MFEYKKGNSFLHKMPAAAKLIFIPILNILFLCLPLYFSVALIVVQFIFAVAIRLSFKDQFEDFKPIIFYVVILIFTQILICVFNEPLFAFFELIKNSNNLKEFDFKNNFVELFSGIKNLFLENLSFSNQKEAIFLLIKIFCVMQSSSLVFKTTSTLQMRDAIFEIEKGFRKFFKLKMNSTFTDAFCMFLNFIPLVNKIWAELKRAWIARHGKNSIKMYFVLMPILFSVGLKKAYNMARAVSIRK